MQEEMRCKENLNRKALFLYSKNTGRANIRKHLPEMIDELRPCFASLDVYEMPSMEAGVEQAKKACGTYDVLIVFGGDGTMRNIIDAIAPLENAPILGYINGGTLSDIGVNFGIKGSHKHALNIIKGGRVAFFDVGKINNEHFGYVAALGAFADIPYTVRRDSKKRIGRLAYYLKAVQEAFVPDKVKGVLRVNGEEIPFKTPFLLCLSGRNMAGFLVSRKSRFDDGKFELYITKPGLFNGLLHYFFFKMRTDCYVSDHFEIQIDDYSGAWDLDGEAGPYGTVTIDCLPRRLRIFCAQKYEN